MVCIAVLDAGVKIPGRDSSFMREVLSISWKQSPKMRKYWVQKFSEIFEESVGEDESLNSLVMPLIK